MTQMVPPERWQRIKEIFGEAVECELPLRAQYLNSACAGDIELRNAVAKMLSLDDEAAEFMEESPIGAPEDLSNQRIGSYILLKEIGRGGMGAVYLAKRADEEFEKLVAVKIVKRGMDTEDILRRFRVERQILAGLEHPNIARLIDGGTTDDGLPYFVMEYVEGKDIISYSESHHLTIKERLKLFCQICAAVSYAHQNLVIHRDLKPSNIIISRDGSPKLLDFGISKLLNPEANNETGTVTSLAMMTPAYASPEQASGKNVTTTSDVYSLGVMLYKLLTGHMPYQFDSNSPDEMARIISSTEPEKPSQAVSRQWSVAPSQGGQKSRVESRESRVENQINPKSKIQNPKSLRGDLDNIVLMALRKDVSRRYASVEQFSEDILRHLDGLPVRARADTFGYRTTKFLRRHRGSVMAAGLIFLTLLGGIIATWRQSQIASRERQLAEERFDEVRQLANNVVFKYHDEIKHLPGSTRVREMLVKDALIYLDHLAQSSLSNPALQRELARAYMKVGDVQGEVYTLNTGDTTGAIESYRKAVNLLESLNQPPLESDVSFLSELNSANRGLGLLLLRAGDPSNQQYLQKALIISQKLFALEPSVPQRVALVRTYISAADGLPDGDNRKETYRKTYLMAEELFRAEPDNLEVLRAFTMVSSRIGYILSLMAGVSEASEQKESAQESREEAIKYRQQALELAERMASLDPQNSLYRRNLIVARLELSESQRELGEAEAALKTEQQIYDENSAIIAADPANQEAKADMSDICENLGTTYLKLGNHRESIAKYKEALNLLEQNIVADKGNLELQARRFKIAQRLGDALLADGAAEAAISEYKTGFERLEQFHPNKTSLAPWRFITNEKVGDAYAFMAARAKISKETRLHFLSLARDEYEKALKAKEITELPPLLFGKSRERLSNIERKFTHCLEALSN